MEAAAIVPKEAAAKNAIASKVLSQRAMRDDALDEDGAATMIQKAMTRRYLGNNIVFQRQFLL